VMVAKLDFGDTFNLHTCPSQRERELAPVSTGHPA
jgi:hypothetical protein